MEPHIIWYCLTVIPHYLQNNIAFVCIKSIKISDVAPCPSRKAKFVLKSVIN
jgi:hypothetical protein